MFKTNWKGKTAIGMKFKMVPNEFSKKSNVDEKTWKRTTFQYFLNKMELICKVLGSDLMILDKREKIKESNLLE